MIDIQTILQTKSPSQRWLSRYIKLIQIYQNKKVLEGEKHHILPASMFPEYKNLTKFPENKVVLPYRVHFIAHYILAKMYNGKMWFAFNQMRRVANKSCLYEASRKYISECISKANKGTIKTEKQRKMCSIYTKLLWKDNKEHMMKNRQHGFNKHTKETKLKMSQNGIKNKVRLFFKTKNILYSIYRPQNIIEEYLDQGWRLGYPEEEKEIFSKNGKGIFWYNNGKEEIKCKEGYQPSGFIRGRKQEMKEICKKNNLIPKVPYNLLTIKIYDENNILRYVCNSGLKTFCEENDLPYGAIMDSYKLNRPLYTDKKCIKNEKFIKFIGWYAIKETLIKKHI